MFQNALATLIAFTVYFVFVHWLDAGRFGWRTMAAGGVGTVGITVGLYGPTFPKAMLFLLTYLVTAVACLMVVRMLFPSHQEQPVDENSELGNRSHPRLTHLAPAAGSGPWTDTRPVPCSLQPDKIVHHHCLIPPPGS